MIDMSMLFLIGIVLSLVLGVLYLVSIIHVLINKDIGFFRKILWIIVLLMIPVLGMILYYLIDG
jgi:hypothetical protein